MEPQHVAFLLVGQEREEQYPADECKSGLHKLVDFIGGA
jgi:hypothetical protein